MLVASCLQYFLGSIMLFITCNRSEICTQLQLIKLLTATCARTFELSKGEISAHISKLHGTIIENKQHLHASARLINDVNVVQVDAHHFVCPERRLRELMPEVRVRRHIVVGSEVDGDLGRVCAANGGGGTGQLRLSTCKVEDNGKFRTRTRHECGSCAGTKKELSQVTTQAR